MSDSTNRYLATGAVTNTLCVHYLAYHRAEVPDAELSAVRQLPAGDEVPSPQELGAPAYRLVRQPVSSLTWRLDGSIQEDVDDVQEIVRWRYELLLDNRSSQAAHVSRASVSCSLDAVYSTEEIVEAGWTLSVGEVRRVPHTAVFRVADFQRRRTPQIAASLSIASFKAIRWELVGVYADGKPLGLGAFTVALPTVYEWNQGRAR